MEPSVFRPSLNMAVDQITSAARVTRNIAEIDELGSNEARVSLIFEIDSTTTWLHSRLKYLVIGEGP